MSTIKNCDRCGKTIKPFKSGLDEAWRYEVIKSCYPYPDSLVIDLCEDCKIDLVRWLGAEGSDKK